MTTNDGQYYKCLGCKRFDARWCAECRIKSEKEAIAKHRAELLSFINAQRDEGNDNYESIKLFDSAICLSAVIKKLEGK